MPRRGAVAVKGRRKRGAVAQVEGNILEESRRTRIRDAFFEMVGQRGLSI